MGPQIRSAKFEVSKISKLASRNCKLKIRSVEVLFSNKSR